MPTFMKTRTKTTMTTTDSLKNWHNLLNKEYQKPYYQELYQFISNEYKTSTIYPPANLIENALALTPYDEIKCVILGQDPYHNPGQAMGLAFSVPETEKIPPSLINIYKEIQAEYQFPIPNHGDLTYWAKQGVLLLNSILTVRKNQAASHRNKGWENYTDAIINIVNQKTTPVVFMLWGNYAKSKENMITNPKHLILKAPHPSPFSANYGFFGCQHFKKCNDYLEKNNIKTIDWKIN